MKGEYRKVVLNKEDLTKNGVYRIFFKNRPEKSYIGSTTCKFRVRLSNHYNKLKKNSHYNTYLQNVYNLYKDELVMEIIECIDDLNIVLKREKYWIDYYDSYNNGYNLTEEAESSKGFKMPDVVLEKRRIKYLQYDLDGNFIKEWNSYVEISKEIGEFASNKVLISNNYSAAGYMWRKKLSENYPLKIEPFIHNVSIIVAKYSLDGNLIKSYKSIDKASIENNIPAGNISKAINGKRIKCYGYLWLKSKDGKFPNKIKPYIEKTGLQKPIIVYFEKGGIQKYKSIRDFCNLENVNRSTITITLKKSNEFFHKKLNQKIKIEFYE